MTKTNRKQLQNFSTSFLIGVQKRVLPRDSHYFLLGPINPFKGVSCGQIWMKLVRTRPNRSPGPVLTPSGPQKRSETGPFKRVNRG